MRSHSMMRPGWEDIGSHPTEAEEHQAFLDETGEAVRQWELAHVEHALASTRLRHIEVEIEELRREFALVSQNLSETGEAMHRALNGLCADAQQMLSDAGYVQLGDRIYRVDASDGLSLHKCTPLRIGGVGTE